MTFVFLSLLHRITIPGMRQALYSIMILFSFSCILKGQTAEEESIRLKQSSDVGDLQEQVSQRDGQVPGEQVKKGYWNLSVGTEYSYISGYGSVMGLHAAPAYTLSLNQRWSLHGGLIASGYSSLNSLAPGDEASFQPMMTSLAVFGAASYRMSERLTLHGVGVKYLLPEQAPPLLPYPSGHLSLGATYRLGDNISIGATIRMNRGMDYYPGSLYRNFYYQSPYDW
jgi:hypothetical protein